MRNFKFVAAILFSICSPSVAISADVDDSEGGITFKQDGLWGLFNQSGKVVIPPRFDEIFIYESGNVKATKGDTVTYFNYKGIKLNNFDPNKPVSFDEDGFAEYTVNGKTGLINSVGEWAIKPILGYIKRFGLPMQYVVHYNGGVGVIDVATNRWIIPNNFYTIGKLSRYGIAKASKKGKKGFINHLGQWVSDPGEFESLGEFDDYGYAIARRDGKCGFINEEFKWVVDPISEEKYCFGSFDKAGLFRYSAGKKFGIVNRQNKVIVASKYDEIGSFANGFYPVKEAEKWGYMDPTGKVTVAPQFEYVMPFSRFGVAWVRLRGRDYLIDRTGKILLGDKFESIGYFDNNGFAPAKFNGKWGAIDKNGRWIIKPKFDCIVYCYDSPTPPPTIRTQSLYFRQDVQ